MSARPLFAMLVTFVAIPTAISNAVPALSAQGGKAPNAIYLPNSAGQIEPDALHGNPGGRLAGCDLPSCANVRLALNDDLQRSGTPPATQSVDRLYVNSASSSSDNPDSILDVALMCLFSGAVMAYPLFRKQRTLLDSSVSA